MTVNPFQIGGAPGIAFGQDVLDEFKIDNVEDLALRQGHAAWSTLAWALLHTGDIAGAREANAKATASGAEDAGLRFRAPLAPVAP